MESQSLVNFPIPEHLLKDNSCIQLVPREGGTFGFAPLPSRVTFHYECAACHGEAVAMWAEPRFCQYCGAEIAKPPRRDFMTLEDPFEPMDRDNHNSLRQALREAIGDFFGERLEAQGNTVCIPK